MKIEIRKARTVVSSGFHPIVIQCPFCNRDKKLDDPAHKSQTWQHECNERYGQKVWFLNGYALAGIEGYIAEQRRADGGPPCV